MGKEEGLVARLEPLVAEASQHVRLTMHDWQEVHERLRAGRSRLASQLPSPPDLFTTLVAGIATVRLAPGRFTSQERTYLTKAWEEVTGDKRPARDTPGTKSKGGCLALPIAVLVVLALAATRSRGGEGE